jgi:hypothetical protein
MSVEKTDYSLERGLPANIDAERSILGAILLDNLAYSQTAGLAPDDFSLDSHRRIYARITEMAEAGTPVDLVTLAEELSRHKQVEAIGGSGYLSSLTDGLPHRSNIGQYVRIVKDKALLRRFIHTSNAAIARAMDEAEPAQDVLTDVAARLAEIAEECPDVGTIQNLGDIPSLEKLDFTEPCFAVPDVLPYQRVTVLAGQAGSGKTYLMLAMAIACATGGKFLGRECMQMPVLILDRENSGGEMRDRIRKMAGDDVLGIKVWGEWVEKEGPPDLSDPRLLKWAKQCKPLIIADSLGQFLEGGDEKEITDIAKLFQPAHRLKNMGATIAIIAHVSDKPGAPAYRGHSSIKGNTDLLTILSRDRETELLTLKQEKHRGNPETIITIRADFATGEFSQTDNPIMEEKRNDTAAIAELIAAQPGISQNQIRKAVGVHLDKVRTILTANTGKLWRPESGPRGATCYFPMSVVSVPELDSTR